MSQIFEITVSVLPADIDGQNHVNNTVYLRWVQDVATAHWEALAPAEAQEAIGWVVLRHEIDYKAPAILGDEIVLRTWVGEAHPANIRTFHRGPARVFPEYEHRTKSNNRTLDCRGAERNWKARRMGRL